MIKKLITTILVICGIGSFFNLTPKMMYEKWGEPVVNKIQEIYQKAKTDKPAEQKPGDNVQNNEQKPNGEVEGNNSQNQNEKPSETPNTQGQSQTDTQDNQTSTPNVDGNTK